MNHEERKSLRDELLQQLYDFYFEHGRAKQVMLKELNEDIERKLAYQYLTDKGLVAMHATGGTLYQFKITAEGIDYVEESPLAK